jgi:beta-N-acetylhexosaminidase
MRYGFLLIFAIFLTILVFVLVQLLILQPKVPNDTTGISVPTKALTETKVDPLPLGRHFMIGHWAKTPVASTTELIVRHQLGGVIIMSAPTSPSEIKDWTEAWQAAVPYPLIIAIDQEGGEVSRLRGFEFETTGQRDINSPETAYSIGQKRGRELAALGITMNFAPVLDTATQPTSFLYKRVFPRNEVTLAGALAAGLTAGGVTPVAKHFPGHPDTPHDSHLILTSVPITPAEKNDFIRPFATYINDAKPAALMTAHVAFPAIDKLPATISPYWLTTVLREELRFSGLIITDDMSMDAIDVMRTSSAASKLALEAGADIILFAAEPENITGTLNDLMREEITIPDSDARLRGYTNK